jgi:hypothetical protein
MAVFCFAILLYFKVLILNFYNGLACYAMIIKKTSP